MVLIEAVFLTVTAWPSPPLPPSWPSAGPQADVDIRYAGDVEGQVDAALYVSGNAATAADALRKNAVGIITGGCERAAVGHRDGVAVAGRAAARRPTQRRR